MINWLDFTMYVRYYEKKGYLTYLKTVKGLDYTGRIEDSHTQLRGYEGCYPVRGILRKLAIVPSDNILDIGCGKGLFLYYATAFAFSQIDGIEYADSLVQVAKKNAAILSDNRLHIFHQDAREYAGYEKYNYFFINNPFSAEIMEKVAEEIKRSLFTRTRRITVIYQFPFHKEIFIKKGFTLRYDRFPNAVLTLS